MRKDSYCFYKMERIYYVYILASKRNGTLYIGVTKSLWGRLRQHKEKEVKGFTQQYDIDQLVYYEEFQYIEEAIRREKQLKRWKRDWKIRLIEGSNPAWNDLSEDWF